MKQAQQSLFSSLPSMRPAPRVLRRPPPVRAFVSRRVPLWLAVHLPDFALEARLRGQHADTPQAVIDSIGNAPRICIADAAATHAGVLPGMTLAAAWSLLPTLAVHERDPVAETALLHRLAAWAGRYTPSVCIDHQALLLEVRGSLQLFGGASALQARVRAGMQRLGFRACSALAPTPRAALWLAHAGHELHVDHADALPDVIGNLPVAAAGFEADLLERLRGIGARRLRDLMRLPRDGFARRYGARVLRELDQALGRVADVRRPLPPPRKFLARVDLLYEISHVDRLLHPVEQLLHELDGWLQATQQGASRLRFEMRHRDRSVTAVMLGFATATRDAARMRDLAEQKLETLQLPAPVLEIVLRAEEVTPLAGRDSSLFREQRDDDAWPQLVERLCVRLGNDAVRSIAPEQDHCPERAWRFMAPGTPVAEKGRPGRPRWLLDEPQALRIRDQALDILDGPERIETGWWNEDIVRDYYVARDAHGRRLWIYCDVKSERWWLHGIFD